MKTKTLSIHNILLTAFLLLSSSQALFSQGNDSIRVKGLFVGLSFGPSQSKILNEGASAVSSSVSKEMNAYSGAAEVGYYFSKYFGLTSGIGYSTYNAQVTLASWQSKFSAIDSEKENFEMRASGTNITEDQKLSYLTVPVYLNFRLPFSKSVGLFLQSGVNLAIPVGKDYSSTGTFTYKGYYSKYNVLLENLPLYGFPSSKSTTTAGQLGVKSWTVFAVASAGLDFFVAENLQISLAASYCRSISDVSAQKANDQYQLSPAADQLHSLMEGSSKVSVESKGLSIILRRYF